LQSFLKRLPAFESLVPGDELLRIRELERRVEDFRIAELPETRQHSPDLRGDRIIAVAVPAQNKLRLLPEIFEIGHGRATILGFVGGLCPFGLTDAPYCNTARMTECGTRLKRCACCRIDRCSRTYRCGSPAR
jgi:hypothetical protein